MIRFPNLFTPRPVAQPPAGTTPRPNTLRPLLVSFEHESARGLPTAHRLIALHQAAGCMLQQPARPGRLTAYDLLVLSLLLPHDTAQVVMLPHQYRLVLRFLHEERYNLLRGNQSPFWDVPAETIFQDLGEVLYAVEDYTSIIPLNLPVLL